MLNKQLFLFSMQNLWRYKQKNFFVYIIITLLIALLATFFLTARSLQESYMQKLQKQPDITLVGQKAGRYTTIQDKHFYDIVEIEGVQDALPRVYGYYTYSQENKNIFILGIDPFVLQHDEKLQQFLDTHSLEQGTMYISKPLQKLFEKHYYKESFHFIKPSLEIKNMKIAASVDALDLEEPLYAVMSMDDAREIFGYKESECSDIALYLSNKNELLTVIPKVLALYPNAKIMTKEDEKTKLLLAFNYDKGVFITLFIIALVTFFMIIYDKVSGLNSGEKKEIGILKALGWCIEDVLHVKFYEAFIISFLAYISGIAISLVYIIAFDALTIQKIFLSYTNSLHVVTPLHVTFDVRILLLMFILVIPVYIAAILFPSWRLATADADEVMR